MSARITRITSLIVFLCLIASGLIIFSPISVSASTSGDVYGGSGDWVISQATIYNGETISVSGSINITAGGSLTLTNTHLTVQQPGAWTNRIWIRGNAAFLAVTAGSIMDTTNSISGVPNVRITIGDDVETSALRIDNSTISNYFIQLVAPGGKESHICNSTMNAGGVWATNPWFIPSGDPEFYGPFHAYNTIFQNANTSAWTDYDSIIELSNYGTVSHCAFTNITMGSLAANANSLIRTFSCNHIQILENTFNDDSTPAIYIATNPPNLISSTNIDGNHFPIVGAIASSSLYMVHLQGAGNPATSSFSDNIFTLVRNGSKGMLMEADDWQLNDNRFDAIDGSKAANVSMTGGIWMVSSAESIIHGTIINNILGPGMDTANAGCIGIFSQDVGNFTVCHSVIRNLSGVIAHGISVQDSLASYGNQDTGIVIHANRIYNIENASNGIGLYGGEGAVVSWNNISGVDLTPHEKGCAWAILLDSTVHHAVVHNNSVTDSIFNDAGSWNDYYRGLYGLIPGGAYCIYGGLHFVGADYADNHVEQYGDEFPGYFLNGWLMWTGYTPISACNIDVQEDSTIWTLGFNVTVVHDNRIIGVSVNGTLTPVTYLSVGTSSCHVANSGDMTHFVNVTVTPFTVVTSSEIQIIVLQQNLDAVNRGDILLIWSVSSDDPTVSMTFSFTDLASEWGFRIFKDGGYFASGSAPYFDFSTVGPGWFNVTVWYPAQISRLVMLTYDLLVMGVVVSILGASVTPLKDPKNRKPERMMKIVINAAIYIVIASVLLVAVYQMFIAG